MRHTASPTSLLILAVAFSACGEAPPRADVESAVRDSMGVAIVENRGSGWDSTTAWSRSESPLVRLGDVEGEDPATQFSLVRSVARLGDGRIVVLATQAADVRWFDRDGNHLVTSGGRGQGPGELNFPARLTVLPGDTVVVEDRPRMDHVFFAPDGRFVREESLDMDQLVRTVRRAECLDRTLPDLSLLMCQPLPGAEPQPPDPGPGYLRRFTQYVRLSRDLEQRDTLGLYGGIEQWGLSHGERTRFAVHPFHARTFLAAGGDPMRVAIARNPDYSIEVWTPEGDLERIVRRLDGRRVATAVEAEEAEEVFLSRARDDEALANRFRADVPVPDSLPAVTDLGISSQGELWVGRTLRLPSQTRTVYDVFGPEGRYLGDIDFPAGFTVHEVGEDYVLGVRLDDLNVPYVELYELRRRGP